MIRQLNLNALGLLCFACTIFLFSCGGGGSADATTDKGDAFVPTKDYADVVKKHCLFDPQGLNPFNISDSYARMIFQNIFQPLVAIDYFSQDLVPILASEMAEIKKMDDGRLVMNYSIRPEATWDDGKPITGKDVAFSLKVMKAPKVDNQHAKLYFEYVQEVIVDEADPKKFQIVCEKPYMGVETSLTDLYIIPASVYDPEGHLSNITVADISKNFKKLENDDRINKFATFFNSNKFLKEVAVGSGPYTFDRWETNQRIVLKRKADWYGHKVKGANHWFDAHPKELIMETVNDLTTAIVAMKGEKLDVMGAIPARDFVEDLQKNEEFKKLYNLSTPDRFAYGYMGMNKRDAKFSDVKTRLALTHIMNVEEYLEKASYGLAKRVAGPVHPLQTKFLNKNLKLREHDLDEAKKLLAEAGWGDSDEDGILDRNVDGDKIDMKIDFLFPNGSKASETAGLIFQEYARKVGVKVDLVPLEWSVMLDRMKQHKFDMYIGAWMASPIESDPKQLWHTESYNGGSNYCGFGNSESDKVIETLRSEIDPEQRIQHYHKLQELIYDDCPYIFLSASQNKVAIHRKYEKAEPSVISPGFWMPGFKMMDTQVD